MTQGESGPVGVHPFPGLRPFREEEQFLFFGRERQIDTMVDKLAERRFLAVVGASGSGKSSLVNCGLRPGLHSGLMARAGTSWRVAQFRPGGRPIASMARSLAREGVLYTNFEEKGVSLTDVIDTTLRLSKLGLIDVYEQAHLEEDTNLLVVVDQFEELFRFRHSLASPAADPQEMGEEARAFVNLLLEVNQQTTLPIYVVITMRSDFLGDCTQFPGLAEAINAGQYLVPRLTRDERRQAIVGPVLVAGAEISPVLVTRLVNDVGDNPDQLSILQHALNRTWEHWLRVSGGKGPLEVVHYEAIGTMERALDTHAEQAYGELGSDKQRRICEKVFKALTDKATDPRGIRRPTSLETLLALTQASEVDLLSVLDHFRSPACSFLMPPASEDLDKESVIDISHESLMRVWQRLDGWAEEEARSADQYLRLAREAQLHAQNHAALWRDPNLALALEWYEAEQPNAAWASRYQRGFDTAIRFLLESRDERERLKHVEMRRRQRTITGLSGLAAVFALLGSYAWWQLQETRQKQAESYAATALSLLSRDPLDSVVNALAAMDRLVNDRGASLALSHTLAEALDLNWEINAIETGHDAVVSLVVAGDGSLISGGDEGTIRRWRDGVRLGEPIPTGQGAVESLLELRNGDLISGGDDGSLRRWRDGQPIGETIATDQGPVWSLIELSNGDVISGGKDGSLRRWRDGQPLGPAIDSGQTGVFSLIELGNGELISGGNDGSLRRWRDGKPVGDPIPTGQKQVRRLVALDDDAVLAVGVDGTVKRWNLEQGIGPAIETGQGAVLSLLRRSDGSWLSGGVDGTLLLWKDGEPVGNPIQTGQGPIEQLLELPSGDIVSLGRAQFGRLRLLREAPPAAPLIRADTEGPVFSLAVLANGDLISGGADGNLRRWRDGKAVGAPIPSGHPQIQSLLAESNGDLISGGDDGLIRRWRDGKPVDPPITAGEEEDGISVYSLAQLNNGDLMSGLNGRLQRWREGKPEASPIETGQDGVRSLVRGAGGDLVSGGEDGTLRFWRNSKPRGNPINTQQGGVYSLARLGNGELVSGGADGTLRRWRNGAPQGEPIHTGQDNVVWSLVVKKDGEVIIGRDDGKLRWLNPRQLIQTACTELRLHPALRAPKTPAQEQANRTCRRQGVT